MKRRMLALLLALCLVFSNLAVGVSALEIESKRTIASKADILSEADILSKADTLSKSEVEIKAVDALDVSLLDAKLPDCVQELRRAAEVFAADEIVSAFVVMEEAPLADTFTSKANVTAGLAKDKLQKQDNVIAAIERDVLGGEKLNVRYQFTYLTNSISIETEFANLEKIAQLPGVKSVFITPVYNTVPTNETANPNTAGAAVMTGVDLVWEELGYTGKGMKIAVIDTGLDLDHPSFAAAPELTDSSMTQADVAAVLGELNAYGRNSAISADRLYRSEKVPFAFNYGDDNLTADHSRDNQGDHGTHVAGIAAANALKNTTVKGMAPDAQVIVLKVFGANRAGYMDDIVAALEDAMTLGCDVVNASLGSPAGFTTTDTEIDLVFDRLADQEIVVCFSAGNEDHSGDYNMWGTDMNRTANPDNATVGEPGVYHNVLTVASADNAVAMGDFFYVGDEKIFYQDNVEYLQGQSRMSLRDLEGRELRYVFANGLGNPEDFYDAQGNSLVSGKVAIVQRGELSFSEKIRNAQTAGAVACIIWNNNDTDDIFSFGMVTVDEATGFAPSIPSALISLADGNLMAAADEQTILVSDKMAGREDPNGGQMSSFSSWGVAPDLTLEPDITGVGGNVYSTLDNGQYGLMSGTSMSSPQVAGICALMMERLHEEYPDAPAGTLRTMAEAMLMSTAAPILGDYAEVSPRQQGAGLVDAYQALQTDVYMTVNGGKPKASLGDSATGTYTFTFDVHNKGTEAVTYYPYSTLNTEYAAGAQLSATEVEYFMYGMEIPLDGEVTFDKDAVTVPAGGTAKVTATVTLAEEDKAYFEECWENGGFVNGYVYLMEVDEEGYVTDQLNLPFLGFYGDWTEAPVFDTAYWYDNTFLGYDPASGLPEGDMYYHAMWTDLGGNDWVLGLNPYTGEVLDQNGKVMYDPAYNVVSPNGDGYLDGIVEVYLSLLRNAKKLTFTWTVDGEVMHEEEIYNNPKTMFRSNYGQVIPWIYSWYGWEIYDFTDADGYVLPSGTEVLLTIDAEVDYGNGGNNTLQIPMTVDTQAGQPVNASVLQAGDGRTILELQLVDDVALAAAVLMDYETEQLIEMVPDVIMEKQADGSALAYFDITNAGDHFYIGVCDYGTNEGYYELDLNPDDEEPTDPTDPEPTDPTPSEPSEPSEPEYYDIYVGGVAMADGDYLAVGADETTSTRPSGGYAHYENGKLYFHNYSYRGQGAMYDTEEEYYAIVVSWTDLEIVLEGENTLTQTDAYSDNVFIVGELSITGSGKMTTNGGYYSIWSATGSSAVAFDMDGGSWIARNATLGMEGGIAELYSGTVDMEAENYGFACDIVNVYGGNLSLKAFSTYDPGAGYIAPCALIGDLRVADGLDVQASVNVNGPLGEFNVEDQLDYHWVVVGEAEESEPTEPTDPEPTDPQPTEPEPTEPEYYDLYVGGVGMTDGDYLAVGATETTDDEPESGYAHYENGKLYLCNYSYRGQGAMYEAKNEYYAIIVSWVDLQIVLEGENTLTQIDDWCDHVFVTGELDITGSGKMTTNGGFYSIWSGTGSNAVTFDMNGGSWIAKNAGTGIEAGIVELYNGTVNMEAAYYGFACNNRVDVAGGNLSLKSFSTEAAEEGYIPHCALVGDLYVADDLDVQASVNVNGPLGEFKEANQWDYHWIVIGEPDTSDASVIRLAGANRYATGFAIADQLKVEMGVDKFEAVVVAYGQNFPDALTGSYLAAVKNAPILLTEESVDGDVLRYLNDNLAAGGKVYILGGTAAVSQTFETAAKNMGFNVKRLKGAGRYETNLAILREAGLHPADEILIATGTNYADSLSASATGRPMLLVGDKLTDAQKEFLEGTSKYFIILGGTGAVSAEIEAELDAIGYVERVKGASRYGTSVAIAERFFRNADAAVLAYAQGFPDGLCGGPLAIAMDAPLILTSNESFRDADAYVEGMTSGAVTGGTGRISDATVREIFDLPSNTPIVKP